MKRYIVLLLVAIITIGAASGQIVRSTSSRITVEKEKKEPQASFGDNWVVKVGGGGIVINREKNEGHKTFGGYDLSVGYQHDLHFYGTYVGGQAGIGSAIYENKVDYYNSATIFLGPTLGLKHTMGENTIFDGHIGVGYERLIHDKHTDDSNRICWELGLGLWYKRMLFEIEYRGSNGEVLNSGILFNLGFKF